jgi:2-methylisocitrate lyase-like PEP mutase family enzyme
MQRALLFLLVLSTMNAFGEKRMSRSEKVVRLRELLANADCNMMPCCYDGLTASLVEQAGFDVTFMTGFGTAASYGLPDTGLLTVSEMVSTGTSINAALKSIPCVGDGDTGYGNPVNVKRTIQSYIQAGFSGIMIEDQVMPKRCGHTKGKLVVDREEAARRIKAACDARDESGEDLVILARTDSRGTHSLDEAIERCKMFRELGADWTFLEAPQSIEEMERYCHEVSGPKMANMLEFGKTPILPPKQLAEIGFSAAAYPLTLLSAGIRGMKVALEALKNQNDGAEVASEDVILPFEELKDIVGFNKYYGEIDRYL